VAHLRRWLGRSSLRRTNPYASFVASSPPCIWTILVALVALSSGVAAAQAQTAKPAPKEATEPVIQQLEAFRRGDFDTAYTFASSEIKEQFSRPAFEQMVKMGYPEIAHSTFATIAASAVAPNGHVYLSVKIRGANGNSIEAYYELVLESDQWKINGVTARPDPGLV
jgi:Domain of unknown function (DUF4864)